MKKTPLRIHFWGEKILRKKCRPVKEITDETANLLEEMLALMRISGGMGLAANQAGLDTRLVVIEFEGKVFKLVNPKIVKQKGKTAFDEGCLSFPDIILEVPRSDRVWVLASDEKGNAVDIEAQGILAVAFQHEIDHINGTVFIDRIPLWEKIKLAPKLKEIKKLSQKAREN